MRLLVTRPLDESQALAERLEARGHQAAIEPLLTIAPDLFAPLSLEGVQALLFTSANGVRAFALRSPRRDLPVYAVGPATAAAAREIGCATVESAGGDVRALAALVVTRLDPARGALLHVAGRVVAGDLAGPLAARGFVVGRAALYAAEPATRLSAAAHDALADGVLDGVLLFSPRSAATFAAVTAAPELRAALSRLTLFALSPAVAEAVADLGWRRVAIAATPDEDALLALVDAAGRMAAGAERMEGTQTMSEPKAASEPAPPTGPPPASVARPRAAPWPVLLVGLVAVAALALDLRVLLNAPGRDAAQAARESAARDRVDQMERTLAALQPARGERDAAAERDRRVDARLDALAAALNGLAGRIDAIDREVRAETARAASAAAAAVAALQASAAPGPEPKPAAAEGAAAAALAALTDDMRRLRAEIETLRAAAPASSSPPPPPPPPPLSSSSVSATVADTPTAAIAALRAALAGGTSPAQALAPMRARIAAHPSLADALVRLEAALAASPPDLAALRAEFPAHAAAALRAVRQDQPAATWWAPLVERLQALVAIRRVGERAGEDDEALLARAEQRLAADDPAAALALLARLSPAAAAALAPWTGRARALEARDAALAQLLRAGGATP